MDRFGQTVTRCGLLKFKGSVPVEAIFSQGKSSSLNRQGWLADLSHVFRLEAMWLAGWVAGGGRYQSPRVLVSSENESHRTVQYLTVCLAPDGTRQLALSASCHSTLAVGICGPVSPPERETAVVADMIYWGRWVGPLGSKKGLTRVTQRRMGFHTDLCFPSFVL